MKEDLSKFYEKHDPTKVKSVDKIVKSAYLDKL
jgi:hypothetical protein